ncbi:hypothetical protein [Paenarthrobacter sp. YJN-5]|uniref:hypothetical protein n=1 Tax=Paenarthrobacter sp. YJN-5 TaxID=2735316 RepID=UPI001878B982|nr:hypothetical protein [Paenarthrobacter sp. YJN-5]QOT19485.1 hypothetical protein HMI59_22880 [Paenarthrobacter sp. YJN-5]
MTPQPHDSDVPVTATGSVPTRESEVSAYADPEGDTPWAMQLVVRVEKASPPSRQQVAALAATAVAAVLGDPRAVNGGEWQDAIARWTDGRIRKHCRRARGAAWTRAEAAGPGITVKRDGVEVRACVPTAVDQIPADIARLQLTSTSELPDVPVDEAPEHALHVHIPADLPWGKAAAAAGHAAQLAMPPHYRAHGVKVAPWWDAGFPVHVTYHGPDTWPAVVEACPLQIVDAGFTVVEPGTVTAVASFNPFASASLPSTNDAVVMCPSTVHEGEPVPAALAGMFDPTNIGNGAKAHPASYCVRCAVALEEGGMFIPQVALVPQTDESFKAALNPEFVANWDVTRYESYRISVGS